MGGGSVTRSLGCLLLLMHSARGAFEGYTACSCTESELVRAVARRAAVALDTAPVISAPAAGVNWTAEASRASSRTRTKPSRPEMVDPTMAGLSFAQPKGGLAKAHKAQVQHVYVRSSRPDDGTQAAAKGAGYGCGGLAGVHVTAREKLDAARTARRKARQIESDEDEDDDAEGAGVGDPAAGGRAD